VLVENGESAKAVVAVPREIVHGRNGFGSQAFVNRVFEENRRFFGPKRKDGARRMRSATGRTAVARALSGCGDFPLMT